LRLFNHIKGIYKPFKEDKIDTKWLETSASEKEKKEWNQFYKYCDKNGIKRGKI
jgi:hypothetical protein